MVGSMKDPSNTLSVYSGVAFVMQSVHGQTASSLESQRHDTDECEEPHGVYRVLISQEQQHCNLKTCQQLWGLFVAPWGDQSLIQPSCQCCVGARPQELWHPSPRTKQGNFWLESHSWQAVVVSASDTQTTFYIPSSWWFVVMDPSNNDKICRLDQQLEASWSHQGLSPSCGHLQEWHKSSHQQPPFVSTDHNPK